MIDELRFKLVYAMQEKARICYGNSKTARTPSDKKFLEQKADVYLDCGSMIKKIFEDHEK
jgi:hypothetical protein